MITRRLTGEPLPGASSEAATQWLLNHCFRQVGGIQRCASARLQRRERDNVRLEGTPQARTPEEAHTQSTPLRPAKSRSSPNPSINDRTRSHRKRPGVSQGKETFLHMLMVGLKREIGRFPGVQLDRAHTDQRLFYTTRRHGQVEILPKKAPRGVSRQWESRSGPSIKAM